MVSHLRRGAGWLKDRPHVALIAISLVLSAASAASAAGLDSVIGDGGCQIVNGIGTKTAAAMTGISIIAVMIGAFGFGEDGREFIKKFAWAIIPGFVLLNVPTILKVFFSGGCG